MDFREMAEELVRMSRRQHVGAVLLKTCIEDKLRAAYSQGVSDSVKILEIHYFNACNCDEGKCATMQLAQVIGLKPPSEK